MHLQKHEVASLQVSSLFNRGPVPTIGLRTALLARNPPPKGGGGKGAHGNHVMPRMRGRGHGGTKQMKSFPTLNYSKERSSFAPLAYSEEYDSFVVELYHDSSSSTIKTEPRAPTPGGAIGDWMEDYELSLSGLNPTRFSPLKKRKNRSFRNLDVTISTCVAREATSDEMYQFNRSRYFSNSHVISSSLNGNNGEWTNTDDIDDLKAMLKIGGAACLDISKTTYSRCPMEDVDQEVELTATSPLLAKGERSPVRPSQNTMIFHAPNPPPSGVQVHYPKGKVLKGPITLHKPKSDLGLTEAKLNALSEKMEGAKTTPVVKNRLEEAQGLKIMVPSPHGSHNGSVGAASKRAQRKLNQQTNAQHKANKADVGEVPTTPQHICLTCHEVIIDHGTDRGEHGLFLPNHRLKWNTCNHYTCAKCVCSAMYDGGKNKGGAILGSIKCPACCKYSNFSPKLFFKEVDGDMKHVLPADEEYYPPIDAVPIVPQPPAKLQEHTVEMYIRYPNMRFNFRKWMMYCLGALLVGSLTGMALNGAKVEWYDLYVIVVGGLFFIGMFIILIMRCWFGEAHPNHMNDIPTYIPDGEYVTNGCFSRDAAMSALGYRYKMNCQIYKGLKDKAQVTFVACAINGALLRNIKAKLQSFVQDEDGEFAHYVVRNDVLHNTAIYIYQSLENAKSREDRIVGPMSDPMGSSVRF